MDVGRLSAVVDSFGRGESISVQISMSIWVKSFVRCINERPKFVGELISSFVRGSRLVYDGPRHVYVQVLSRFDVGCNTRLNETRIDVNAWEYQVRTGRKR